VVPRVPGVDLKGLATCTFYTLRCVTATIKLGRREKIPTSTQALPHALRQHSHESKSLFWVPCHEVAKRPTEGRVAGFHTECAANAHPGDPGRHCLHSLCLLSHFQVSLHIITAKPAADVPYPSPTFAFTLSHPHRIPQQMISASATVTMKLPFRASHSALLWFRVMVMLRLFFHARVFLVFSTPPPLPLFALNLPLKDSPSGWQPLQTPS
jgi:hypothetical protein